MEDAATELDEELVTEFTVEVRELCDRVESILLGLEDGWIDRPQVNELFRVAHTIKGGGMGVGIPVLPEFVHRCEDFYSLIRDGEFPVQFSPALVSVLLECNDAVRTFSSARPIATDGWPARFAALLARIHALGAPTVAAKAANTPAPEPAHGDPEPAANGETKHAPEETLRVKLARVDLLIRRIGELSVQQQIVAGRTSELESTELDGEQRKLSQLCAEAHDVAMSLRMVTVRPMLQGLRRTVRDTAGRLGKNVRFATSGEDSELDIVLVQILSDALMHMVRNAVDHGIESPEDRMRTGKPAEATVAIAVSQQGGHIEIEVSDDGRGIDVDRVRAKAIDRGWLDPGVEVSQEQLFEYMFRPGFSTNDKVTEFSGRGVGLDVVRQTLRELDGSVTLSSELGRGSTFRVQLPISVAVIDVMLVNLGGHPFLIPLHSIHETIAIAGSSIQRVAGGASLVNLRGTTMPIYDLLDVLERKSSSTAAVWDGRRSGIVTRWSGQPFAFAVDDIVGRQHVVVKPLGRELCNTPGITGSAVLGDGRVGLIVDLVSLIRTRGLAAV